MRYAMIVLLILALGCQQDSSISERTSESQNDSRAKSEPIVDSDVPLSKNEPQEPSRDEDLVAKYNLTESELSMLDLTKDLYETGDQELDVEAWVANHRRQPTAAEFEEIAIDLGLKPHPDQTKEFTEEQLEKLFGNSENLEAIAGTTSASFYFLKAKEGYNFKTKLSEYERLSDPVSLSDAQTNDLIDKLSDARNYGWRSAKGCLPAPGVALALKTDKKAMTVVFCFECNILCFYDDKEILGGEDFDMLRPDFVEVLKSLYPTNELIQGLPPKGCGLTERN